MELTVTMAVMMLVMGSLLTVFASVQRSQSYITNRSESMDELRLTMDRIAKDVRQATSIDATSTAGSIGMTTFVLGVSTHVSYSVTGTTLYRQQGAGGQVPIQTRLASANIFVYTPAVAGAEVVAITLEMTPRNAPNTTLVLDSEIRLRNAS